MKIKFRPVREFLKDALGELMEFETVEELLPRLRAELIDDNITAEDISFQPYHTDDRRIGWQYTYLVLYQLHTPVGYTDGVPR